MEIERSVFSGQGYDASVTDLSSIELFVGDDVSEPLGDVKIILVETTSVDTAKEVLASYIDNENSGTAYSFVKMTNAVGNESYQASLSDPQWPSYSDHALRVPIEQLSWSLWHSITTTHTS